MRPAQLSLALKALLATTLIGLVLGFMGPFGNYQSAGLLERLCYWVAVLWLGLVIGSLCLWPARSLKGWWLMLGLACLLFLCSTVMAALTWLIAGSVWPEIEALSPLLWWLENLVIGAGAGLVLWFSVVRPYAPQADAVEEEPVSFIADAICLQMEDHYVRVHTEHGQRLVLMRLRDAIDATRRKGTQVHRSWWVAFDAIAEVCEEGRNLRLRLKNGLNAPVSRANVAKMRSMGLLGPSS